MNDEYKNIAIVLSGAALILFLAWPKKKPNLKLFGKPKSFDMPTIGKSEENQFSNAVIGIKAVRSAINAQEPKSVIDDIKAEVLKTNDIRIIENGGLLTATTRTGKAIAKEE